MSSVRNQFKATSTKVLKTVSQKEDAITSKGGGSTDRLTMTDGLNKFRILPKHMSEETYAKLYCKHWITIENDKGEPQKRTVPNSKIHAGTKKDIIEEYIQFVTEQLDGNDATDKAKIKALTNFQGGLAAQTTWLCYAMKLVKDKEPEFGKLELKKAVRDEMNNNSIVEDEDEAIEVDPFTDPDDGLLILVTYNSKAKKPADYYKTTISKNAYKLTNEFLEMFAKKTPLSQLPEMQYGAAEFEMALEGLRYYDENNEINLFDTDDFQAIVTEVSAYYAKGVKRSDDEDDDEEDRPAKKTTKKPSKTSDYEEEEETPKKTSKSKKKGDILDDMDRNELKKFKAENEITEFKVVQSMTDDEIRENLRQYVSFDEEVEEEPEEVEEEVPFEEEPEEVEEAEEEEEEAPAKVVKKTVKKQAEEVEDEEEEETPKKATGAAKSTKSASDIRAKLDALKKNKQK